VDWKDVEGKFPDQFEVQFGIEQMIENDVVNEVELLCELEQM
jgi:hypothetical protein